MEISNKFPCESISPQDCKSFITLAFVCSYLIQESFNGCGETFAAVAGLTGWDDIASGAFSFPGQGHHMIHGQVFRSHQLMTEVALPLLDLGLPPWSFP